MFNQSLDAQWVKRHQWVVLIGLISVLLLGLCLLVRVAHSSYPHCCLFSTEETSMDVRSLTVKSFPQHMAQWKVSDNLGHLFNDALQMPCPFLMSFNVRVMDREKALSQAQFHTLNKEKSSFSPLAKLNPALKKEYADWSFVKERLHEGERLVKSYYQVVLFSEKGRGPLHERQVRDLFRANGWQLSKDTYLQLPSFLAALPMMMSEGLFDDFKQLRRLRTLTCTNAVNIAPLQGEYKGTPTASLLLPGRRGQIATWDPFDSTEGNFNVAIAAKSGSGKSALTQEYMVALVGGGARVWVIDVGRSYEKTCELFGGLFIDFDTQTPISLNPFTHIKVLDESLSLLKPLLATMARPNETVTSEEMTYLEQAIKAAWQQAGNEASISTVAAWLKQQTEPICKNLSHLLYSYTVEGMYGRYFEGPCTLNMDNPLVVCELQALKSKKDLQKIVLLMLMYHISEAMYQGERRQRKSCIIDEAWGLLGGGNQQAAEFIEVGYRTARRFRGNFVTITQSLQDYFMNPAATAAFENSDHNIILAQKPDVIRQLTQSGQMDIDPFTERLYQSLRKTDDYSECVIKGPSGLSVHRILFDPFSKILYSSKGEEVERVKHYQAQGLTLQAAIEQVAKEVR